MRIFSVVFSSVCALVFAALCGIKLWSAYAYWAIACYVAIIAALPVCSFLHELGHMLFGAMVKIKTKPHFSLFGSSCCEIIPKNDKRIRGRVIFAAFGGIFVNGALAAVGLLSLLLDGAPLWLCVFLPASLYLFFFNGIPFVTADGGKTDGLVICELITGDDAARVMIAVLTVQAQVFSGKPIAEVDEELLMNVPQIREDDMNFIALTELRYEYFKARGDTDKAEFYKERFDKLKEEYM